MKKTATLPQANFKLSSLSAKLDNVGFSMVNKKLKWSAEAGSVIENMDLKYTKGENTRTKFDRIELRNAKLDSDSNLTVDLLKVSGLDTLVTRQFIDGMIGPKSKDNHPTEKAAKSDNASNKKQNIKSNVVIGQLVLDKGTHLRFRDKRVDPPVILNVDIERAEVKDIDTSKPEKQAQANVIAKINEFTNFVLKGQATAVGPKMDMTLNSKLENLSLPAFSSYAAEFGGVHLDTGQLSSEVKLSSKIGELDGGIHLDIKQLDFSTVSATDAERLSETAGMPISTAASLLKDRYGNIDLTLPVSGSVTDPDVDISQAINKAVSKTLISIYPPTLVLSILASGISQSAMSIQPITFKPGSSDLDSAAKEDLDKVVTLTKDRPTLLLNVCGRATAEDFTALTDQSINLPSNPTQADRDRRTKLLAEHDKQMRDLAIERGKVVQRYLINEKGLTANQVSGCRPVFDPDDKQPPRVVISL